MVPYLPTAFKEHTGGTYTLVNSYYLLLLVCWSSGSPLGSRRWFPLTRAVVSISRHLWARPFISFREPLFPEGFSVLSWTPSHFLRLSSPLAVYSSLPLPAGWKNVLSGPFALYLLLTWSCHSLLLSLFLRSPPPSWTMFFFLTLSTPVMIL